MKASRSTIFLLSALSLAFLPAGNGCRAEGAQPPPVDQQALGHLKRMSDSLAGAKAFTFDASRVLEVPTNGGQFLTMFSNLEVALKRPDKLRVELKGDAPHSRFYFDGSGVSAYAPQTRVYSKTPAPKTIDAMLPELERETGIKIAVMPLLFTDPYKVLEKGITRAYVAGHVKVHGEPCVHLAFQSPGVNWELWIDEGSRALPRRLAVTVTDRLGFPRTLLEFSHWNLRPWLRDGGFNFRAPSGAKEIPFGTMIKAANR